MSSLLEKRGVKALLAVTVLAVVGVVVFYGQITPSQPSQVSDVTELDALLNQYEGRVLFLDIMNTDCTACRRTTPELVELHERWRDEDQVKILSLSVAVQPFPRDSDEDIISFKEEFGAEWNFSRYDNPQEVVQRYQMVGMPTFLIFNPDGEVVYKWPTSVSASIPTADGLSEEIQKVLSE